MKLWHTLVAIFGAIIGLLIDIILMPVVVTLGPLAFAASWLIQKTALGRRHRKPPGDQS